MCAQRDKKIAMNICVCILKNFSGKIYKDSKVTCDYLWERVTYRGKEVHDFYLGLFFKKRERSLKRTA